MPPTPTDAKLWQFERLATCGRLDPENIAIAKSAIADELSQLAWEVRP